jgi:uncharacterized protein YxeA
MKKQFIIILIVLSFIAPALHFIQHSHNYNPFTKRLEHSNNITTISNLSYSKNQELDKSDYKKTFDNSCQIKIINNYFKDNYCPPFIKSKYNNQYIYLSNILIKDITNNKTLFFAPKNSPPIA